MRRIGIAVTALTLIVLGALPALADGFIVPVPVRPDGPKPQYLSVKYHHVKIDVENQALVCSIDQVFHNENPFDVEGEYIFPVPEGAVMSQVTMEVDGEPLQGKMLPRDEAKTIYENIVRQMKDPLLLEYMGRDLFRARIFPIPANADKRVTLRYEQPLLADNGLVEVRYPLNTEKFSSKPLEDVSVAVDIRSQAPIASVYSPSHEIDINRESDRHVIAGWEEKNVTPNEDFLLYYTVSQKDLGVSVISTMREGEDAGYFLLLAAPPFTTDDDEAVAKDVVFVLDTSGSMKGDNKIEQARDALDFCVQSLNDRDRVNVIRFSTSVTALGDTVQPVSKVRDEALEFVRGVNATGGTNIEGALEKALASVPDSERPRMVVFLTDGNPTVGNTDMDFLLNLAKDANKRNARIFVWGVGYDVNIHFLDKLAEQASGMPQYIRPEENIEVPVSSFFSKLTHPALSDIELTIAGVTVEDMYPQRLPDLFHGSQLLLAGRYKGNGSGAVVVKGKAGERDYTDEFSVAFESDVKNDFVPRIWAARKIGFLLDQIRLHKKDTDELIDEVVDLSMRFGIMTEYTSFLVAEGREYAIQAGPGGVAGAMGAGGMVSGSADWAMAPALEARRERFRGDNYAAWGAEEGGWAMAQSANSVALQSSEQVHHNLYVDDEGEKRAIDGVRYIAGRAFYFRDGRWEDAEFGDTLPVRQVQNFSRAQFSLADAAPVLNQYLSLGERVVIVSNGQAIEFGPEGDVELTDDEIDALLGELKGQAALPQSILPADAVTVDASLASGGERGGSGPDWPGVVLGLGIVAIALIVVRGQGVRKG